MFISSRLYWEHLFSGLFIWNQLFAVVAHNVFNQVISLSVLLCSKDIPGGRRPCRGVFRCMQVAAGVLMISLGLVLYHLVGEAHGPQIWHQITPSKTVSIQGTFLFPEIFFVTFLLPFQSCVATKPLFHTVSNRTFMQTLIWTGGKTTFQPKVRRPKRRHHHRWVRPLRGGTKLRRRHDGTCDAKDVPSPFFAARYMVFVWKRFKQDWYRSSVDVFLLIHSSAERWWGLLQCHAAKS